ncbi:Hypothetical_protein [Hexamita inflata]|uniref:Hypothetical_protein n=1 Tax=Hexamita inflata TaxID=28002 RepID=A0AA86QHU2_9EUKA|nr:Hypothetical protein HINF_LOCUS46655 [Hexamita inflata]
MLNSWLIFQLKEDDNVEIRNVFDIIRLFNDVSRLNWIPDFIKDYPVLKLDDYLPIRMLNPAQGYELLDSGYLHQAVLVLMLTPLFIGLGSCVQSTKSNLLSQQIHQAALIHLSVYSFYVCMLLYKEYETSQVRARNVGFQNGKEVELKAALSMEILEQIIVYCAFIFQETAQNQYTDINSYSTWYNEKFNGRLRKQSFDNNTSIKAEAVIQKIHLLELLAQKHGIDTFSRRTQYQHIINIEGEVVISQEDQDKAFELAQRTVQTVLDRKANAAAEQNLTDDLMKFMEVLDLQTFFPVQQYRESTRSVKNLTKKNGDYQGKMARMINKQK